MNAWLNTTLGNISVIRKLSLGFGLVLVLTLLITATGWNSVASVIERGDKLANISRVIALIKDLRIARVTYDKDNGENGPGEVNELLDEISASLTAARAQMVRASDLNMINDELQAVAQYKNVFATLTKDVLLNSQTYSDQQLAHLQVLGDTLVDLSNKLSASQLSQRDGDTRQAKTTLLVGAALALLLGIIAAWIITRQIVTPLRDTLNIVQAVAAGDLSQSRPTTRRDELGQLQQAIESMRGGLRELVSGIGAGVTRIASAAEQLSTVTGQTSAGVNSQRVETDQVATAMNEMAATVHEVARNAQEASEAAITADQQAREGDSVVAQAIEQIGHLAAEVVLSTDAMAHLKRESDKIGSVLDVIKAVSQQTNLLALNAAIEAARAGEHGRGFAVVAEEVRRLAGHTTEATGQVGQIIERFRDGMDQLGAAGERMHQAVQEGRSGMLQVVSGLDSTRQAMDRLDERVGHIATGTEQIGAAVRSINGDVQQIAQVAGDLLGKAGQVLRHSQAVREDGDRLLQGLGDFRLELHRSVQRSVEQLAADARLSGDIAAAERLLSETLRRDARFELFYLVDANGVQLSENIFASDVPHQEGPSCRGRNWGQRPWFRSVADDLRSHITPVYRSSATDDFCFTVSAPILGADGRLLRVLGADVRLSVLV